VQLPEAVKPLIACLACLAGGCLQPEDDTLQFAEDFEGELSGWTMTGEVAVVTTNHPGEHAMWLAPGASMEHALSITRSYDGDENYYDDGFTDGNWIEYSVDCGGRPALSLEPVTLPAGTDNRLRVRVVIEGPPIGGFAREKLMFPALPSFIAPLPDDPDFPYNDVPDIQFTSLVVASSAPCHVDNLRILVSGGTLGY
jgi:hypothetical protein